MDSLNIEIERDGEMMAVDKATRPQSFYAGTFSGWVDRNQTLLTVIGGVFAVLLISLLIAALYVHSHTEDSFDDDYCWPFACEEFVDESSRDNGYHHETDWEVSLNDTSGWAFRLPSPTNRDLYSVTYFDSELLSTHYVAVGEDSTILVSEEGTSWQLLPPIAPFM